MTTWLEDLEIGRPTSTGSWTVTRDEIVEFAREFDPQPFHLDDEVAKKSVFGGLCASGWHTAAIMMRLLVDARGADRATLGSPGFDDLRWLRPVRPGDTLTVRRTCIEVTPSRSRPDRGSARFKAEVLNQDGEVVLDAVLIGVLRRRPAG